MAVSHAERVEEFRPDPTSVAAARRFVRTELDGLHVPEPPLEAAVLLTSELASNAVLHARTDFQVRLVTRPDCVRVEVHDGNTRHPGAVAAPLDATSGRGLVMIQNLARSWGIDGEQDGKSVWFEMPIGTDV